MATKGRFTQNNANTNHNQQVKGVSVDSAAEAQLMRKVSVSIVIFIITIILAVIILPLFGNFIASATDTTASSTVLSMLQVWLIPMLFIVAMTSVGDYLLCRAIWRRFVNGSISNKMVESSGKYS